MELHWEILDPDTLERVPDGKDFESSIGFTVFEDLVAVTSVDITPRTDNEPEFSETFIIRLYNVTSKILAGYLFHYRTIEFHAVLLLLPPTYAVEVMFSLSVCVCVCLSVQAITFVRVDTETSFLVW